MFPDIVLSTIDRVDVATGSAVLGVGALRSSYLDGRARPLDVVDLVLERLARRGQDAVWISTVAAAQLRDRARALERLDPAALPLFGIPFAVKDNIDAAGLPTTAACPAFAYEPPNDATAVRRLLDAGALLVGKTNLDQFATGLTGVRSPYGACESVYGEDLISGGSSSGSAVAVAAGVVAFSLGTDTAGSGRVPAAMNGIVGLKPTRGLVSNRGVVPACRSLDCVSVFTHTLQDAADVLSVIAGPDPADPWSRAAPPSQQRRGGLRLAVPDAASLNADPGVTAAFEQYVNGARRAGAHVVGVDLQPFLAAGELLYRGPWVAERLAGLASFVDAHPDDVLPVTRAVLESGRRFSAVDAFAGLHRLQDLRARCDRVWADADALVVPTVPTTFTRAEIADDPIGRNLELGRFTQFANLLDLAAVAVPLGLTADGRPVGVTLLGPAFSEAVLLDAARSTTPQEVA
jgi:allophanate hydrolase